MDKDKFSSRLRSVFKKAIAVTVEVWNLDRGAAGAGVVVSKRGLILTVYHLVVHRILKEMQTIVRDLRLFKKKG